MQNQLDHPEVVMFPPLLLGLTVLSMIVLNWLLPLPISLRSVALLLGIILTSLGIGCLVWGRTTLLQAGTNVNPLKPTTAIVSEGPFRFSRNPLYVGGTSFFIGLSLAIGTGWGCVLLVPFALILHYGIILPEERYLEQKFGDSYLTYKRAVRRYL
jgi:protein-S-isoprenylcysteine O-methyltransferase Ste14